MAPMNESRPQNSQSPNPSQGLATPAKMMGGVLKMLEPMTMPMMMLIVSHRLSWPCAGPPLVGGVDGSAEGSLIASLLRPGEGRARQRFFLRNPAARRQP